MERQNQVTFVLGRKGHGKSSLVKQRIQHLERLIIYDPRKEYRQGVIYTRFLDLMQGLEHEPDKFQCVCRFEDPDDVDSLLAFVRDLKEITFVAEEVDWICDTKTIHPDFEWILKYGRHHAIDLYAVTRRPAETNVMLRSQADVMISFKQSEPADLDYLAKRGFNPDELKALEHFQYITLTT